MLRIRIDFAVFPPAPARIDAGSVKIDIGGEPRKQAIAADRLHLRGETIAARCRQEPNWIAVYFADDAKATQGARLRLLAVAEDPLLLDEASVRHILVRKGSAAERALLAAAEPAPAPQPKPQPTPQPAPQLAPSAPAALDPVQAAITASLREGRQCTVQEEVRLRDQQCQCRPTPGPRQYLSPAQETRR